MPQKQPPAITTVCLPFAVASGSSSRGSGIVTLAVAAWQPWVAIRQSTARIRNREVGIYTTFQTNINDTESIVDSDAENKKPRRRHEAEPQRSRQACLI